MGCISKVAGQNTLRRIQQIQAITIVWMSVEAGVSLAAAWAARSPALLALGGDSAVELLSATVVLWRFRTNLAQGRAERNAARVEGALLFALTAYVIAVSAMSLLGQNPPRPSHVGIGILIAAAIVMPWLAKAKQKLSAATGSAALRADTAQSGLCAYLSLIALLGLAVNATWHIAWADPIAALAVTPLMLWEGKRSDAWKGVQLLLMLRLN
jgi:divalent metal cation (Fe/Co/Zn/Cd) transporter